MYLATIRKETREANNTGIIPYWTFNVAYHGSALAAAPLLFEADNVATYATFGLIGIGGGIAGSILTTRTAAMPEGRDLAIEFFTGAAGANLVSLAGALFTPRSSYSDAQSLFPDLVNDLDFAKVMTGTAIAGVLASRYLSIVMTEGKTLSKGEYTLLINGYLWASGLTALLLLEADFTSPYTGLISALVSDASAFILYSFYEDLRWTSTRAWFVSLGGVVGASVAGLSTLIIEGVSSGTPWVLEHFPLYVSLWSVAGIAAGTFLTRGMEGEDANGSTQTGLFLMPTFDETGISGARCLGYVTF